ncbi:hypothetical protein SDJN03_24446, partial [Cucurbita argyrosperma subsp. sororia]
MGSPGSGAVDYAVGSIVWVRRRNGSWWPGKILGSDELSSSHLTSPRSGTPVKLLGREDASVDWYNLEKSKRVKPFRCGEFDDCIERAESSQGMPIKKREKYARREDAILHALELEKELLKKQGKLNLCSDQMTIESSGVTAKKETLSSEHIGTDDMNDGHSESHQFSKIVDVNYDSKITDPCHKSSEGAQLSGEDDHSEARPRMRGLQDFGLRITPSKRKVPSSSVVSNGSEMLATDTNALAPRDGVCSIGNDSDANGMQQIDRVKRSKCMYLPADSSDSLEYREPSLGQVEMSTPHSGTRVMPSRPDSLVEEDASGSYENDSSDSETDSDSSRSDQDVDNDTAALSDSTLPSEKEPSTFERTDAQEHVNMSSEEPDDSVHSGDMSHPYHHEPVSTNEAVSKWQLKGKRNVRNLSKRPVGVDDEPSSHLWVHGKTRLNNKNYYFDDSMEGDADALEEEYYLASKRVSKDQYLARNYMPDWEGQPALKGYWDVKNPLYGIRHHFGGRTRTILIDVDLKVHASYQKEPVPIVSLMSKLNGQAIIGHPIQIETLEDGFSETLLSDGLGNGPSENDGSTALQPAWRTARRTANVRIPRPHLPTVLDGEEAGYDSPFGDQERKTRCKRVKTGVNSHKAGAGQGRGQPHIPRASSSSHERRLPRKMVKKVSISSNNQKTKTRTLSSIGVEQNHSNMAIHDSVTCQMNGLMKPESSGPPTVACIPVKLVFSRLLEKINRPPSKATTTNNVVLLLNNNNSNTDP